MYIYHRSDRLGVGEFNIESTKLEILVVLD